MDYRTSLWIKAGLLAATATLLIFLLASVGDVVQLVAISALLAYLLDPLANRLESRGLSRTTATLVLFAGILFAFGVFFFFLFPYISAQVRAMQAGSAAGTAEEILTKVEALLQARLGFLPVEELNLLERTRGFISTQLANVVGYLPSVVSLLGELVIVPFIMFFLIKDGRAIKKGFISLIPNRYFEFTLNVLHKVDVQLGNYLRAQLLCSIIVGLLSFGVLWLMGVPYAFLIGAVAGLTNLIPYMGPVLGALAAIVVSFISTGTFDQMLPILAAFIGIQLIDNAAVQPFVLARNVELHPLLILITLLIAGKFFGVIGLLLAIPATAILKVIVQEMFSSLRQYHLA